MILLPISHRKYYLQAIGVASELCEGAAPPVPAPVLQTGFRKSRPLWFVWNPDKKPVFDLLIQYSYKSCPVSFLLFFHWLTS